MSTVIKGQAFGGGPARSPAGRPSSTTVIKAGEAGQLLSRARTVDLADHLAEARSVVHAARRQAAKLVQLAELRAEDLQAEALKRGYAEGYARGEEAGRAAGFEAAYQEADQRFREEHALVVEDAQRTIAGIEGLKEELRLSAEQQLLEFALHLARKLTFAIGEVRTEAAAENLRRALRLLADKTNLIIRVHPRDVGAIRETAATLLERISDSEDFALIEDDTLAPGGCTVRNAVTEVDASLEAQVDQLVGVLLGKEGTGE